MSKKYSVGIDLGTSNSCIAIMQAGQPKVLINKQGSRTTPSIVAYTSNGDRLVGQPAKSQQVTNPKNTIFSAKRFIGRKHNEVLGAEKNVPYDLVGAGEDMVKIKADNKQLYPQAISAEVLSQLKRIAEEYVGQTIESATITVPAYFDNGRRQATKQAGEIAGFKVQRIIAQPTSAALAYGIDKLNKDMKVVVYDLGGGTFDVSVLHIADGVFETLSTNGDCVLGGDNWDQRLLDYIAEQFKAKQGIDLRNDPMALQRLRQASQKAKCELSTMAEADINLPFITANASGPKHLQLKITRSKFEQITDDLFKRIVGPCEKALSDSGLRIQDIDEVLLVGGSTRMPKAQQIAKQIFGREPNKSVNPDECVAVGAAIQASILAGDTKDVLLLDVTPLSLGLQTMGGVFTRMIDKNTTIPVSKSQTFSTAVDNQPAVTISVFQGERDIAVNNKSIGRFDLVGIQAAPRGTPQIEVSFNIDANGILNVSAKDVKTGKQQKIQINGSSGLSKEQIEKMINDAEQNKQSDKAKKQLIQVKNQAQSSIFYAQKQLVDNESKLSEQQVKATNEAITKVKNAISEDDKDLIVSSSSELFVTIHNIIKQISPEQQATGQSSGFNPEDIMKSAGAQA